MKKILIPFLCLMLLSTPACAITLSHRYQIPNTEYSIEFPWYFNVMSKEMDEYEPCIYEWGSDLQEMQTYMDSSDYSVLAGTDSSIDIFFSILVTEYEQDVGFSSEILSEESLELLADELAKEYFDSHPENTSVIPGDLGGVTEYGDMRYINWAYETKGDTSCFTEHFYIIENLYAIDFIVDIYSKGSEGLLKQFAIANEIMDSVKKNFMLEPD